MAMAPDKETDVTPVILMRDSFHDELMEIIEAYARELSLHQAAVPLIGATMYHGECVWFHDKPSQIQKTTPAGLSRYFCGVGVSRVYLGTRVTRKIPGHQDRLRNKRKRWLAGIILE